MPASRMDECEPFAYRVGLRVANEKHARYA